MAYSIYVGAYYHGIIIAKKKRRRVAHELFVRSWEVRYLHELSQQNCIVDLMSLDPVSTESHRLVTISLQAREACDNNLTEPREAHDHIYNKS